MAEIALKLMILKPATRDLILRSLDASLNETAALFTGTIVQTVTCNKNWREPLTAETEKRNQGMVEFVKSHYQWLYNDRVPGN